MGSGESGDVQAKALANNQWIKYQGDSSNTKMSEVQPFSQEQFQYLEDLFVFLDKKNIKSLEIRDMDEIDYLKEHPFYPRIRELMQEEMRKIKAKRINFELFLYLLTVFHPATPPQTKYKYLFRLYDTDRNSKIDSKDLHKVYRLLYKQPFMTEEDYSKLVAETVERFGSKGEIKFEQLLKMVNEDEVLEVLSFSFGR